MTLAVAPLDGQVADLTTNEAQQITGRIRAWVNAYPLDDVKRAYFGRVWLALGYESWSEWCDCELNGFKLPAVERREVVAELAEAGMSNPAIADVLDVDQSTVYRDKESQGLHDAKPVVGQDGKRYAKANRRGSSVPDDAETYTKPEPKPRKNPNEMEPVFQAEFVKFLNEGLKSKRLAHYTPNVRSHIKAIISDALAELESLP